MSNRELIALLKREIENKILPKIGQTCALYDVPYYKNIGDILIWQGELDFLHQNSIEILDMASYNTCSYPKLDTDVTILFQGGGNIGDLYPEHPEFLKSLVRNYPNNRIIVFSQTVYYQNQENFQRDFEELSSHKDFYFAARDLRSYELVRTHIGDNALLVPDMAFYISNEVLDLYALPKINETLYIKRNDCEVKDCKVSINNISISDWPVFEHVIRRSTIINTIYDRLFRMKLLVPFLRKKWDTYAHKKFRLLMIKEGVEFISQYKRVISERLHGCILSILMNKEVVIVDNSYGKNSTFYNTWLTKTDTITLKQN